MMDIFQGSDLNEIGKDIKLVTNRESFLKTVRKPNFKNGICFSENLMGCEMVNTNVTMNKLVYLGQAILDLSKLVMCQFHYDYKIPKYGKHLKLCYVDTDSLVYHMEDRPLPIVKSKKVIGLMKVITKNDLILNSTPENRL